MSAFIVILPEDSGIEAEEIKTFQHHYELVAERAWLVSDDRCFDASDVRDTMKIGEERSGLVVGISEYTGYGDRALGQRLRKWVDE